MEWSVWTLRAILRFVDEHSDDERLRAAALTYVDRLVQRSGGPVLFRDLNAFEFEGRKVPLIHRPKGINTVKGFDAALTILTTFRARPEDQPYEDAEGEDGYLRYKWRKTEAEQHDNVALRRALEQGRPLIWFFGIAPGVYTALYPVWLVGEEADQRQFVAAVTDDLRDQWPSQAVSHPVDLALRRQYAHTLVRQRLHQRVFRERVLLAYGSRCTLCRLHHPELLDAAHIREDADGGDPIVTNGLAMCAIHHRAFDKLVIGIRPDHMVEVRKDVRLESDGPTLEHALQSLHGTQMTKPRSTRAWPDPIRLEERYERFREAG